MIRPNRKAVSAIEQQRLGQLPVGHQFQKIIAERAHIVIEPNLIFHRVFRAGLCFKKEHTTGSERCILNGFRNNGSA